MSSSHASPPPDLLISSAASSSAPRLTDAGSANNSGPSVCVEDESTKRCSVCAQDRPESEFSSAQLKKKGKRVCHGCVAKKAGAASAQQEAAAEAAAKARKDAMKDAFAARLNSTPTQAASACPCCGSKAAVRFTPCIRCSVECCSLRCFDGHDCDAYLEAKRTMPTELIPVEDRFTGAAEFLSSWQDLSRYLRGIPASISRDAVDRCRSHIAPLADMDSIMSKIDHHAMSLFYARPCVASAWWAPACWDRHHAGSVRRFVESLVSALWLIGQSALAIFEDCARANHLPSEAALFRGDSRPRATLDHTVPPVEQMLPDRLRHKMLTLLLFILRAMPASWVRAEFGSSTQPPPQIDSDLFGLLPCSLAREDAVSSWRLGYLQHCDPVSGRLTLVPLVGTAAASCRFSMLQAHLGHKVLMMILRDGALALDRGLWVSRTDGGSVYLSAVSGWTGQLSASFLAAPVEFHYMPTAWLENLYSSCHGIPEGRTLRDEIEARKRHGYFHIVPTIKAMVPEQMWPRQKAEMLFIPTPQLGIESELAELSLLESLVEEAAAGDERAQLLLAHIESECAAPIAEVISAQKSRLEQMLEDQAAQLRIHAEAVKRAELRGRIKAAAAEEDGSEGARSAASVADTASASSASSAVSSSASSSTLASTSAASVTAPSVSTALSSASSASAASGESAVPYSWTASKAYASLADVCTAGRAKYKTITSAALRFLHTLRPVSVNRSGGSHTVFHFASGKPVTLVQPHGGDGTVSRHAATRLYAVIHEAALQQLSPAEALPAARSGRRAALTEAPL